MFTLISVLTLIAACSAVPLDGERASKIINGETAQNLQYPFAVSIQYMANTSTQATRGHRCGGALITLQHVLTAASCMFEWNPNGSRTPIVPANYRVFAGSHLLSNDTNTSGDRVRGIAQTIVHPNYQGIPSYLNDIAIVLAVVEQKFARKYIYNQQTCTQVYNTIPNTANIHPTMICAASYDIVTTGCNGDEGNALVCGNTLTGILALHGNCASNSFPELYTRVNNYTQWIQPYISSASTFSSGISLLLFLTLVQMSFTSLLS